MEKLLFAVAVAGCASNSTDDPAARKASIDWRTDHGVLRAASLDIDAGETFGGAITQLHVNGSGGELDPQNDGTIEATWKENGVEMRLFVYLHTDGTQWWSDEIRHYDGAAQGDWVTYTGDYFRSPIGSAFMGDLDLPTLHLHDLFVAAFLAPVCHGAVTIEPYRSFVDLWSGDESYYVLPLRFRDANCAETGSSGDITWTLDDPTVASVAPMGTSAEFRDVAVSGATMATISMTNNGNEVASYRLPIIVTPWQ
ncbi:MAG TPA: hypothetical protein VGM90_13840 [Kofleriaceae bacterium]|jgi:hypothetical protein